MEMFWFQRLLLFSLQPHGRLNLCRLWSALGAKEHQTPKYQRNGQCENPARVTTVLQISSPTSPTAAQAQQTVQLTATALPTPQQGNGHWGTLARVATLSQALSPTTATLADAVKLTVQLTATAAFPLSFTNNTLVAAPIHSRSFSQLLGHPATPTAHTLPALIHKQVTIINDPYYRDHSGTSAAH